MSRILVTLMALWLSRPPDPDLTAVIQRATNYVANYEAALGNLIGIEDYVQESHWSSGRSQTRHSLADFLILRIGSDWVGLRDVNTVDGKEVRPPRTNPADSYRLFNSIKAASSRYNIGDVMREANLPTFALQILRTDEVRRFSFRKDGVEDLDGISTWRVEFMEKKGKTLVRSTNGKDLHSSGVLWIDPDNGRVLKTEFDIDNRLVKPEIKSSMVVSYAPGVNIDLLVPKTMTEHYDTQNDVIDCRAEYSDFRAFHVDVKLDFGGVPSRRP